MATDDYIKALKNIEKERGIPEGTLLPYVKTTLAQTLKRNLGYDEQDNAKVRVELTEDGIQVFCKKQIAVYIDNPLLQISIDDAEKINRNATIGDWIEVEVTPSSRVIISKFRQAINQKIIETEKDSAYNEYEAKIGSIVSGYINRIDMKKDGSTVYIVDFGKVDGVLKPTEQVPGETFKVGEMVKFYLLNVKDDFKGRTIELSRTHPELIKRLYEIEAPEIADGTVEIMSIVREPGSRTKMSVKSNDENVEALGACIGIGGTRIQAIVDQINGEKIDIIEYSDDPTEYITNSLSPATPTSVEIDEENHHAKIVVPKKQLSLAIGKNGQNVRLAAKLTTWKMDILSD
ncbi:MAG: transcription termination/antitermination protein NusA [Abditibacteriota bacterium]|nr:transcription termination/antitermination protein NusA [Abditibacteriota bacterium]